MFRTTRVIINMEWIRNQQRHLCYLSYIMAIWVIMFQLLKGIRDVFLRSWLQVKASTLSGRVPLSCMDLSLCYYKCRYSFRHYFSSTEVGHCLVPIERSWCSLRLIKTCQQPNSACSVFCNLLRGCHICVSGSRNKFSFLWITIFPACVGLK